MTDDPIAQLVADLRERGKPTLAWTIRWSAGNRDPVAAAWEATTDRSAMLDLLGFAGIDDEFEFRGDQSDAERLVIVRRRYPVPPTLAELLAASHRT